MEMISVLYVCTLIYKRLAIHSTQPIVLQLINLQCYVLWQIILLSVILPNRLPPFHHRDKLPPHQVCTAQSLSHCDQGNQFLISHLLKGTKQTSFKEHLKEKNKK